ncbi:hypothetical protein GVO57_09610 [Sphingomonas changnyeongensis]|uniref:DUF883 domain-containing protein n=1 Tax=Sphingomonas changnyeongensis TaxID=2698679 RepID=A0A7Z2NX50_9SPHN|nr:hypothetical protein [Sphingomonas changnyeongensis]QHL91029.1 hypothetical protein GVO57_09610 [Sphingomonas changnyeongensis]
MTDVSQLPNDTADKLTGTPASDDVKPDTAGSTGDETADAAENAATPEGSTVERLRTQFGAFASEATGKLRDAAGQGKEKAEGALEEAARFLTDAARTIEDKIGPQYARYAVNAAESVAGFAASVRRKDVEELVDDAREMVRKSPAVAIGVAVGVGFVLARLVRAGLDNNDDGDSQPSAPTDGAASTGDAA